MLNTGKPCWFSSKQKQIIPFKTLIRFFCFWFCLVWDWFLVQYSAYLIGLHDVLTNFCPSRHFELLLSQFGPQPLDFFQMTSKNQKTPELASSQLSRLTHHFPPDNPLFSCFSGNFTLKTPFADRVTFWIGLLLSLIEFFCFWKFFETLNDLELEFENLMDFIPLLPIG